MATFSPSVEQWREPIQRLGPDMPVDFMLASIDEESGGNPCALSVLQETGLVQAHRPVAPFNNRFGATFTQLRAPCGSGSTLARQLTSAERDFQAQTALNVMRGLRDVAAQKLADVGADWSQGSTDFWNFVKLGHGLPALQSQLLPQITAALGRPPASWDEFKQITLSMSPSEFPAALQPFAAAGSVMGLQNRIADVFVNAERAGKFGGSILSSIVSNPAATILVFGGAAALLVYLIRRNRG